MKAYIALDVGGTSVSAAVVSPSGSFICPVSQYDANANSDKADILKKFACIITEQYKKAIFLGAEVKGVGLGFPGPFDYHNGISLMKGIGKYDSLYGVNIKKELLNLLDTDVCIKFRNDADLYCLGECVYGVGKPYCRCICICIGTGIGSGFYADGKLITESPDVPQNGWIYNTPYRDGIADEYLSASGIMKMVGKYPETKNIKNIKELAQAAYMKLPQALQIFENFGSMLCDVIPKYAVNFDAECLILGGAVSRSCDLFDKQLTQMLAENSIKVLPSSAFSDNTLLACALLFQ